MQKTSLYSYKIDPIKVIFSSGRVEYIKSKDIESIIIEKDFDNAFLPVFHISCKVFYKLKQDIIADRNGVKFNVKMTEYLIRDKKDLHDPKIYQSRIGDVVLNQTFSNVLEDVSQYGYGEISKKAFESKSKNDKPDTEMEPFDLYLFINSHLNKYKSINNTVLRNENIPNAIIYLATNCGMNNILFASPDNYSNYEQIIIPQFNFLGDMNFLQEVYGIYNKGLTIFQDFDTLYIMDKSGVCKCKRPLEIKKVVLKVNAPDDVDNKKQTNYIEDNIYYINVVKEPKISSKATEMQETQFDEIKSLDTLSGSTNSLTANSNGVKKSKNNIKLLDNTYSNNYIVSSLLHSISESNTNIDVELDEISMKNITPNKEYHIKFNLKYETNVFTGNYRLNKVIFGFINKNDGLYMTCNAHCEFKSV